MMDLQKNILAFWQIFENIYSDYIEIYRINLFRN